MCEGKLLHSVLHVYFANENIASQTTMMIMDIVFTRLSYISVNNLQHMRNATGFDMLIVKCQWSVQLTENKESLRKKQ
jgi:hypothetical protein